MLTAFGPLDLKMPIQPVDAGSDIERLQVFQDSF